MPPTPKMEVIALHVLDCTLPLSKAGAHALVQEDVLYPDGHEDGHLHLNPERTFTLDQVEQILRSVAVTRKPGRKQSRRELRR